MDVLAIIQARMGSTRLPAKVLKPLCGKPMLRHLVERISASRYINETVVATTDSASDDHLSEYVRNELGLGVFRGSNDDVLDRFYNCARQYDPAVIVRVTADDPLKDPEIIDNCLAILRDDPALDYCSNTLTPTYPEGLDIEAFTFAALKKAYIEATLPSEREHVTPYIWKHLEIFKAAELKLDRDLSSWRLTVDKESDFRLIEIIFEHFQKTGRGNQFTYREVIEYLESNPGLLEINRGTKRNEGYEKSLKEENK